MLTKQLGIVFLNGLVSIQELHTQLREQVLVFDYTRDDRIYN